LSETEKQKKELGAGVETGEAGEVGVEAGVGV